MNFLLPVPIHAACPDTSSVFNAEPLQESWAVDWWMPRHNQKLTEDGRENARLLFIGDSITHSWENDGESIWNESFAPYGAHNIGFSGDRTENVLWRIQNGALDGLNPDLTVLMIGTNNTGHRQDTPKCTARGIEMILEELHKRLPETHLLLLAIFPRSFEPDDELRKLNNQINNLIEPFGKNEWVTFLNINKNFLTEEEVLSEKLMPDFLHPNEKGYQIWKDAMYPHLKRLLEK